MSPSYLNSSTGSDPHRVVVNNRSAEWLRKGFPWVYPNEVMRRPGGISPGKVVPIESKNGQCLGTGIWDDGWIALRRFRSDRGPLDREFMESTIEAALGRRRGLLPADTDSWRLVNGENDGLPGIRVDIWNHHVVLRLDSPSLLPLLDDMCDVLSRLMEPRGIYQGWRPDPRDHDVALDPNRCELVRGEPAPNDTVVKERGLRFLVRPWAGADVGLYPDMRDNRAWLDPFWRGRSVLNLFAYTGAFSVFAAHAGATRVTTVDLSAGSLRRGRANFRLNGLDECAHRFIEGDTFQVLDRLRRKGRLFDLVLADPPAFSRTKGGSFNSRRDNPRLVAACCRALEPGGLLVLANNQGSISPRQFQETVRQGLRKAARHLRLVHTGTQPVDYPVDLRFPEGRYLKFWVLVG